MGGASSDSFYSMMMPMVSMMNRGHIDAGPPDPNALPAVRVMLSKAVPGPPTKDNLVSRALAYGNIIAGMGGMKGLRGHTLKRLAGTNQDTMMAGSQAFAELNPFENPR